MPWTTCPDCGEKMKRVCRVCQQRRAYQGLLLHQKRFLQTFAIGEIELRVRATPDGVTHVELFDDRWHGYCGTPMFEHPEARIRVRELPADLCEDCRRVFNEHYEKAREAAR